MAYYSELSDIVNNIVGEKMLRNQNLCKLLICYDEDACEKKECESCPLLEDTTSLFMTHIYPLPKIIDTKTEQGAYVCVYLNGGNEIDVNQGYRNVMVMIDIICHVNIWMYKGKYRVYEIMSEIDKMLNDKVTDLPVANRPNLVGFQTRVYAQEFYGVQLRYTLQVNSNVECNPDTMNEKLRKGLAYNPTWTDYRC